MRLYMSFSTSKLALTFFFLGGVFSLFSQNDAWRSKIDRRLWQRVQHDSSAEFLVILTEQADLSPAASMRSKDAKSNYVYNTLLEVAERTQVRVRASLKTAQAPVNSFWVVNAVWSTGKAALIEQLAQLPEVIRIEDNPIWHLERVPDAEVPVGERTLTPISWGLTTINANQVWTLGYTGQGVVVGGEDTGYEWQHPALKEKYRGWDGSTADHNYNWHDAIHTLINGGANSCGVNKMAPCDDDAHGTHTMGTMVGSIDDDNVIGVAPNAKWIGCRNMEEGDGTPATYIECFQWFIAPTNLGGSGADPSKGPHVINNSWGCPVSEGCVPDNVNNPNDPNNFSTMNTVVNNVRAAGILVVVSAGNSGPSCSSVNNPAAIFVNSFSVGATNSSDNIAGFSSRGPVTIYGPTHRKPDISAPGVSIYSSIGTDNDPGSYAYSSFNGTSMAGPHIAGVAALIMTARPDLIGQVEVLESLMENTAVPRYATASTGFCGGDIASTLPNNVYGYGRVNALAAVNAALSYLPVEFTYFTAKASGPKALLQWETAAEVNCQQYAVQHSPDGVRWETFDKVPCKGAGAYNYTDTKPYKGLNYYRLEQTDWSGASIFTNIVAVSFNTSGVGLAVAVQPAAHTAYITIAGAGVATDWQVELQTIDGRLLQNYTLEQSAFIDLPTLVSGIYLVALRDVQGRVMAVEKMWWP